MNAKRIEKWIWPLIYGGLLLLSLGLFVGRRIDGTGTGNGMSWALVLIGVAGVVAGAVLLVLRSRLPDKPEVPSEL